MTEASALIIADLISEVIFAEMLADTLAEIVDGATVETDGAVPVEVGQ